MKKLIQNIREMTAWQRVLFFVGCTSSLAVVVLVLLDLVGLCSWADLVLLPLIGLSLLCSGLRFWKIGRGTAIFSFVCCGVIWAMFLIQMLLGA